MAAGWHCLNLGDALLAEPQHTALVTDFQRRYSASATPRVLITRHESEGRLHCEVLVYFSPGCEALVAAWQARPCRAPGGSGLSYSTGAGSEWQRAFPLA
ncbi:hypothetical protein [Spongiibacter marinus]|uniref:hypothetical protein n=1 Tax=Spongiibacter marinus TaxID=354246 RepID=UPI0035BE2DC5